MTPRDASRRVARGHAATRPSCARATTGQDGCVLARGLRAHDISCDISSRRAAEAVVRHPPNEGSAMYAGFARTNDGWQWCSGQAGDFDFGDFLGLFGGGRRAGGGGNGARAAGAGCSTRATCASSCSGSWPRSRATATRSSARSRSSRAGPTRRVPGPCTRRCSCSRNSSTRGPWTRGGTPDLRDHGGRPRVPCRAPADGGRRVRACCERRGRGQRWGRGVR